MTTYYPTPKFLLQFYKSDKIPPLTSKYDFQSKFNHNSDHRKKNISQDEEHDNYQENTNQEEQIDGRDLRYQLDTQIHQNRQLRLIIKELQQRLERLKEVNEQLVVRVQQLQKINSSIQETSQASRRDIMRKVKIETYKEVEEYLKIAIEKFTNEALNIKMSPILQNKFEIFLQQISNINSLSVKKELNQFSQMKRRTLQKEKSNADRTIQEIVQMNSKSKEKLRQSQEKYKYDSIFKKLAGNQEHQPGHILNRNSFSPNKSRVSKRPRIFTQGIQRSASKIQKKLDF